MIGIALTVIVCAVTVETASSGNPENVRSCEVYSEARPLTDLEPCQYRTLREGLGRAALERAGRQLRSAESVETTCRIMTGGGIPTG